MSERIHVLFLMEDLCYGGTQRQTLQLAVRLDRSRFRVSMLTLTGPTDLDDEALSGGLELYHIGSGRKVDPLFFAKLPGRLRALRPDVIVPCTALPNIWGRIWPAVPALLGFRPAVVGTVRGGGAPVRQHERFLWRLADHIVCNTEALRDIMKDFGMPAERISYIPNGVNTERYHPADVPLARREPRIVCVARICGDKDHATLIDAFGRLHADHPEAILRIVGDGPMEKQVHDLAHASPAAAKIELFPGTPDVREHYACSRVFALTSVREGQPNVLLEAMACGLPICATAVGGIPRLVEEGKNGFLSPAKDAGALARHLAQFLDNPGLSAEVGTANREKAVNDFSFAPMVAAHEAIFSRLAARTR